MRRSILLALTVVAGFAGPSGPAEAQYGGGGVPPWLGGEPPQPRPSYRPPRPGNPPPPGYGYRPPPPPPYYRPPGYGYGYAPPPGRYSNVCITARGTCSTGRPLPSQAPCSCFIPGFGTKRGAVASY